MIGATLHSYHIFRCKRWFQILFHYMQQFFAGMRRRMKSDLASWSASLTDGSAFGRSRWVGSAVCCVIILCARWLCQCATVCGRVSHQVAPIHGSRWRHQDQAPDCQPAYKSSSAWHRMWTASTSALQRTQAHCLGGRTWTHRMQ